MLTLLKMQRKLFVDHFIQVINNLVAAKKWSTSLISSVRGFGTGTVASLNKQDFPRKALLHSGGKCKRLVGGWTKFASGPLVC